MGNQVLDAKSSLPEASFEFFMSLLLDTVRSEDEDLAPPLIECVSVLPTPPARRDSIAECTEVAYTSLSMDAAQKMMMLQSREELTQFIDEAHDNWVLEGDTI